MTSFEERLLKNVHRYPDLYDSLHQGVVTQHVE